MMKTLTIVASDRDGRTASTVFMADICWTQLRVGDSPVGFFPSDLHSFSYSEGNGRLFIFKYDPRPSRSLWQHFKDDLRRITG